MPEKSLKYKNASSTKLFLNGIKTARRNCMHKALELKYKEQSDKINAYFDALEDAYSNIKDLAALVNKNTFKSDDVDNLIEALKAHQNNLNATLGKLINEYGTTTNNQSKNVLIELNRLKSTASGEIDGYLKMLENNKDNISFAIQSTSSVARDPYPERDKKIQEAIKAMKKNLQIHFHMCLI